MHERSVTQDMASRVSDVLARYREPVVAGMRKALDRPGIEHIRYMRYHLGWDDAEGRTSDGVAGKMLRPALCLLCCESAGGDPRRVLPAAVSIELLHNFTLIHDDIEDSSDTRHGRETLWRIAGVPQAINAGDGLFVIAQRTLLDLSGKGVAPERVLQASRMLYDACVELCEGQYRDIGFEGRTVVLLREYETMIRGKAAVLLRAACGIGALIAGAGTATVAAFESYGLALGLAFQIHDDVLGIWGEPHHTGKPAGDDIRSRKKSFPIVHAMQHLNAGGQAELAGIFGDATVGDEQVGRVLELLDECGARETARKAARRHGDDAIAALRSLDLDQEHRSDLHALATFAVDRRA